MRINENEIAGRGTVLFFHQKRSGLFQVNGDLAVMPSVHHGKTPIARQIADELTASLRRVAADNTPNAHYDVREDGIVIRPLVTIAGGVWSVENAPNELRLVRA